MFTRWKKLAEEVSDWELYEVKNGIKKSLKKTPMVMIKYYYHYFYVRYLFSLRMLMVDLKLNRRIKVAGNKNYVKFKITKAVILDLFK